MMMLSIKMYLVCMIVSFAIGYVIGRKRRNKQ